MNTPSIGLGGRPRLAFPSRASRRGGLCLDDDLGGRLRLAKISTERSLSPEPVGQFGYSRFWFYFLLF